MRLRTEIEVAPFDKKVDYSSKIFMIGSCFAQSIGEVMARAKFTITSNPTGTLFNPLSISRSLERIASARGITEGELREGASGWYHYDFHSSLNGATREEALHKINETIAESSQALKEAEWVVITLGTAFVYEVRESGEVVANCHKESASNFQRRMLSVEEIVEALSGVVERELCGKNIILTLSPIRHISDGLSENSLSKATLRVAIDQLCRQIGGRVKYFPAYEIVVDDLRDYRFYGADMVHPSPVAIEYIWEQFSQVALSKGAQELLPRVMRIVRAAEHRAFAPQSESHAAHCRAQLRAIEALSEINFEREKRYFSDQLKINL